MYEEVEVFLPGFDLGPTASWPKVPDGVRARGARTGGRRQRNAERERPGQDNSGPAEWGRQNASVLAGL